MVGLKIENEYYKLIEESKKMPGLPEIMRLYEKGREITDYGKKLKSRKKRRILITTNKSSL